MESISFFSREEIKVWEQQLLEKIRRRFAETPRSPKDPRKEKLKTFRNRKGFSGYDKEDVEMRCCWNHKFRGKMKRTIYQEHYNRIRPRDYKTYGWRTW